MKDQTFPVGSTAIVVSERRGAPREITVSKVGRRWRYYDEGRSRFDAETGWVDARGYSVDARVYRDLAHYEAEKTRARAVAAFFRVVHRYDNGFTRDSLTEAAVRKAAGLLGMLDVFEAELAKVKP